MIARAPRLPPRPAPARRLRRPCRRSAGPCSCAERLIMSLGCHGLLLLRPLLTDRGQVRITLVRSAARVPPCAIAETAQTQMPTTTRRRSRRTAPRRPRPASAAAKPDSNSPSWLDAPMNRKFTGGDAAAHLIGRGDLHQGLAHHHAHHVEGARAPPWRPATGEIRRKREDHGRERHSRRHRRTFSAPTPRRSGNDGQQQPDQDRRPPPAPRAKAPRPTGPTCRMSRQ